MIRAGIRRVFQHVGGRRRWERDVEEEIKLHLALRAEQLIAAGSTPGDAYEEAVRRFGPLTESRARMIDAARHREQHMRRTEYFADLRQDLSFALRTLRRQKGWTAVTVLTLALGVGATTAVFSVVSSLLIHAVPYPNGDRVMLVYQQPSEGNATGISVTIAPSGPTIQAWKTGSRSFEALEGYSAAEMKMRTQADPVSVNVQRIEPTFPAFAGARTLAGRMFTQADIEAGGRVVVLSEGFWRSRLGARDVIGQRITLDSSLYTVIGVLPATLRTPRVGTAPLDLWLPLDLRDDERAISVVGRLRADVGPEAAARELDSLLARTARYAGGKLPFNAVVVSPAKRVSFYDSLVMLTYAVALVLLVACANVAHLLMARSVSRRRELAIRSALGAGRGRVLRQMLTESLVISIAGAAGGVLMGWSGMRLLILLRPSSSLTELDAAQLDTTTLGLAALVAAVTAIAFGLLGAFQAGRVATNDSLKATSTNALGGRRIRARTLLIVSEMALSAVLVVGASMLVRSVIKLQTADLGFQPKGLYSLSLSGTSATYKSPVARGRLTRLLMTRLASVSGIQSVALAATPPSWRSFAVGTLEIEGNEPPPEGTTSFIDVNSIGSTYFQTMGIGLVEGTTFTDTTGSTRQVIVNAGFARKHWPDSPAIGHRLRIRMGENRSWATIVGVARDASTSGPTFESSAPMLYSPAADSSERAILIRTNGNADPLAPIQALVKSIDPTLTASLKSVEEQMSQSTAAPRFTTLLLSIFTILALALAAVGLYGVMSFSVAERTREIGIRVALGATRSRVARIVLAGGVSVALVGSLIGIVAASWGTKLIEKQLYGIARTDAVSFVAAIMVLLATAIVACVVPTRRALAVDPMTAIRAD